MAAQPRGTGPLSETTPSQDTSSCQTRFSSILGSEAPGQLRAVGTLIVHPAPSSLAIAGQMPTHSHSGQATQQLHPSQTGRG